MANWRFVGRLHGALYRATGGMIGHRLGSLRALLLTTVGRKSGRRHTLPLTYFADGERLVIVGSNAGEDRPPAWLLNLQRNPEAEIQVGREGRRVRARIASAAERARLWPGIKQQNPMYASYEKKTKREIPLVMLERAS